MRWDHWEVLLLSPMMILDYFMTILGATLAEKSYRRHFKNPDYELNPVWQKTVREKRWFNPRHLVLATLLPTLLLYSEQLLDAASSQHAATAAWVLGLNGAVLSYYGILLGVHLGNILTFMRMTRHPEEVSGEVRMSQGFALARTRHLNLLAIVPLALAAGFSRHPFVVGAATGPILMFAVNLIWSLRTPVPDRSTNLENSAATKSDP